MITVDLVEGASAMKTTRVSDHVSTKNAKKAAAHLQLGADMTLVHRSPVIRRVRNLSFQKSRLIRGRSKQCHKTRRGDTREGIQRDTLLFAFLWCAKCHKIKSDILLRFFLFAFLSQFLLNYTHIFCVLLGIVVPSRSFFKFSLIAIRFLATYQSMRGDMNFYPGTKHHGSEEKTPPHTHQEPQYLPRYLETTFIGYKELILRIRSLLHGQQATHTR